MSQKNIYRVLDEAMPLEVEEGKSAYQNYNRTLTEISEATRLSLNAVAGCFSALSPNSDYIGNLRSCKTLCVGFVGGKPEDSCTVSTYKHNRAKAWRILEGEHFYSVFKGLKVRNFWRNLTEPDNPEAITIDGHMVNIWRGEVHVMSDSGISKLKYAKLAHEFSRVARREDLLPCQLQAILWLTWKRLNRIKISYDPFQALLFEETNRCGIYVPYERIGVYL